MSVIELGRTPDQLDAPRGFDRRRHLLGLAIVLLLIGGIVAALTSGDDGPQPAGEADLAVLSAARERVDELTNFEVIFEGSINGNGFSIVGVQSDASHGEFVISSPFVDDITMIAAGSSLYLPDVSRQGWIVLDGPEALAGPEASAVLGGDDGLSHLESLAGPSEVEVVGTTEIDGVTTTHYRTHVPFEQMLAESREMTGDTTEFPPGMIEGADPMRIDAFIDDAGLPRRTEVRYELQGIEFEFESRIRLLDTDVVVTVPPDSEVRSRQSVDTVAEMTQNVAAHVQLLALG